MKVSTYSAQLLALGASALLALPMAAQSTGPTAAPVDPRAAITGHYHVGELGEKLLLVEEALKCNCGCGLDVHSCQFQMQCGTSPGWSLRIRESLARGETPEIIKAGFVADYGQTVLMLPPAEGFNLVGYLLPAIGIITAGMFVGLLVRGGATRAGALTPVHELTDDDEARLQSAMRRLDAEESPDW